MELNSLFESSYSISVSSFPVSQIMESVSKENTNLFYLKKKTFDNIYLQNLHTFYKVLQKRKRYLDNLRSLPNDWISSDSKKPDDNSIEVSKFVLNEFWNYLSKDFETGQRLSLGNFYESKMPLESSVTTIPKIIMGPIPSGGLCLEFHANSTSAIFITIPNGNGHPEIEIKEKDYYSIYNCDSNISGDLISGYRALTWF
ncbi:MAG: hypothetical protein IJ688_10465 [Treponema sp.]|nr:hypothetical protein [Treponema sp.]